MSHLDSITELRKLLRAPGLGILTLSSGGRHARSLLAKVYGHDRSLDSAINQWETELDRIASAKTVLLGIPSDTGSSIARGSNFGPIGVRQAYFSMFGQFPGDVLDLGDVVVVPQLLHDSMYSPGLISDVHRKLYGDESLDLPVSPLSIARRVTELVLKENPGVRIAMLGGDHGNSRPILEALCEQYSDELAVLQIDAHTDLSEDRFGVEYCYNTWANHVARLIPGKIVQIGIRATIKTKKQWMREQPVFQIWKHELNDSNAVDLVLETLGSLNASKLYITNDIDATDPKYAPATGTAAEGGFHPAFVKNIVNQAIQNFDVIGGDVVEVAPCLGDEPFHKISFETDITCRLGAEYLHELLTKNEGSMGSIR
ncbi:MAG: arginase family protein [Planctomycetota bacterium]